MKWMARPSVTEMERRGGYEMDRRKSAKKHGNATEIDQMQIHILVPVLQKFIKCYPFQWHFPFFCTLSLYPFHGYLINPFL